MDPHDHTGMTFTADAVLIDFRANTIRVRVPGLHAGPNDNEPATLDVGGNGRLIGLEVGESYISVMDLPGVEESYLRSAEIEVAISSDDPPFVSIPRRGPTWEITYPSGNECWQMKSVNGELIQVCATIENAPVALRDAHGRRSGAIRHSEGSDQGPSGHD